MQKEIEVTKRTRINNQIRSNQVKLISSSGDLIGVIDTSDAIRRAQEENLDLVEISPNTFPPIVKIMDWGKYKYELSKKRTNTKPKVQELKVIRLSAKIGEHDLTVKANRSLKFLEKGFKVKAQLMFKGREIVHREVGEKVLRKFQEMIAETSEVEQDIRSVGREISMIFKPNKK